MSGRRSVADAHDTREAILRRAADVGSVEGLEGITIGRLAADLEMSKAGVIGHFGTKEELQLATLDLASRTFREHVWDPARHHRRGLERLLAVCEAWAAYAQTPPFPGGCFIAAASFEFDSRSGRVHDALAESLRAWRDTLVHDVEIAIEAGELPPDTDPDQIAFTLKAIAHGTTPARDLDGDATAGARCLRAMRSVLGQPALSAGVAR
jgi:AcrR family transcriptional regulator